MSTAVRSIALFLSGASIGLLLGLAISPTLHLIIGAAAALTGSIVGALAGVQPAPSDQQRFVYRVDPIPFAVFVIGLAIGSPVGIYLRANDVFGPRPHLIAQRWSGTGLDGKEIQRRLFDQLYPAHGPAPASAPRLAAGLYGVSVDECQFLALKKGEELRSRLRSLGDARISAAAEMCHDDGCLDALRTLLCGKGE
jgi:hypothetical protein